MLRSVLLLLPLIMAFNSTALEGQADTINIGSSEKLDQGVSADRANTGEVDILERLKNISDVDPREWGIRNDCIALQRIKHIRFVDDQSAVVKMRGKKKVLLRLRRECPGIKTEGFLHQARGSQLCARFDRFEVLNRGIPCSIESIEPYFEVEPYFDSDKEKRAGNTE